MINQCGTTQITSNTETQIERYFESSNKILGALSFAIGLGCFSATNYQFYAWLSLLFIAIAWANSFSSYKEHLNILKNKDYYKMNSLYMLKRCYTALIGWTFLAAIALGLLDRNGLTSF